MKTLILLIAALALLPGTPAFAQDPAAYHWKEATDYLHALPGFSGYVIAGRNGQVMLHVGRGDADRANGLDYTDRTLGTIGSITKPFTATAILLLHERGQIDLQAPITRYLDSVPADKSGITIHHLLTHSAGFPGALGDDYAAISADDYLHAAFGASLLFAPGTDYAYSNVGYSILGILLERISGQSYSDFLTHNIFIPAGMKTAGYQRDSIDYRLLTHGYRANGDDWGTSHDKPWNGREPWWHLKANGGLLMSPRDMYQWYLALRDNKILKPETLALQIAPHVPEGGDTWYGYGYAVTPDGHRVEHNGGNGIFKADFRWFPKDDLFIYATSNDAGVKLFRTCDEVLDILHTGMLPQPESWMSFMPNTALDTNRMNKALAFAALIQAYTPEDADAFVRNNCTPELIERNGIERLHEIFGMLHNDIGQGGPSAVYADADRLKLTLPGARADFRVHLLITFRDARIDRIGAELEGQ